MNKITQEEQRAKWREYYHSHGYREAHRLRQNKRYREDDEFREKVKKANLERYYRNKEAKQ